MDIPMIGSPEQQLLVRQLSHFLRIPRDRISSLYRRRLESIDEQMLIAALHSLYQDIAYTNTFIFRSGFEDKNSLDSSNHSHHSGSNSARSENILSPRNFYVGNIASSSYEYGASYPYNTPLPRQGGISTSGRIHPTPFDSHHLDSPSLSSEMSSNLQRFWDLAFSLFLNVSYSKAEFKSCLSIVQELILLVKRREEGISPALLIAMDVIIQRAMYELSDKTSHNTRSFSSNKDDKSSAETNFTEPSAVLNRARNIEDCISIMSYVAIPMCTNEQAKLGLHFLADNNNTSVIGGKMMTLNRQLQELLAWTNIEGQNKVVPTFNEASTLQSITDVVDQTLSDVINETVQTINPDMIDSLKSRLHSSILRCFGNGSSVQKCGSASRGRVIADDFLCFDFVVLSNERAGTKCEISAFAADALREMEGVVELEIVADQALRHLKACIKEFLMSNADISRRVVVRFPELCRRMEMEAEAMAHAGSSLVDHLTTTKYSRQTKYPVLMAALNRYEQCVDLMEKDDKDRLFTTRKSAKFLTERLFREPGFVDVRCDNVRSRFIQVKYNCSDFTSRFLYPCAIIMDTVSPIQATDLLDLYTSLDNTGKVSLYLDAIKKFAKAHSICDSSKGFLSVFAWQVMALHVLLRFSVVPNVHSSEGESGAEIDIEKAREIAYHRLSMLSVVELLDRFFRYYVEEFDAFGSVVTLRNAGETIEKSAWQKNAILWRISIEDPFDPVTNRSAYDLGSTLSRPGQLTTFKALRRAVYGIASIMSSNGDACRGNVRRFFSKTDLIHLARKSDYMGANILEPRAWEGAELSLPSLGSNFLMEPPKAEQLEEALARSTELVAKAKAAMGASSIRKTLSNGTLPNVPSSEAVSSMQRSTSNLEFHPFHRAPSAEFTNMGLQRSPEYGGQHEGLGGARPQPSPRYSGAGGYGSMHYSAGPDFGSYMDQRGGGYVPNSAQFPVEPGFPQSPKASSRGAGVVRGKPFVPPIALQQARNWSDQHSGWNQQWSDRVPSAGSVANRHHPSYPFRNDVSSQYSEMSGFPPQQQFGYEGEAYFDSASASAVSTSRTVDMPSPRNQFSRDNLSHNPMQFPSRAPQHSNMLQGSGFEALSGGGLISASQDSATVEVQGNSAQSLLQQKQRTTSIASEADSAPGSNQWLASTDSYFLNDLSPRDQYSSIFPVSTNKNNHIQTESTVTKSAAAESWKPPF